MAGLARLDFRRKRDQQLRARVLKRDQFTCRKCGWRPKEMPLDYDGKALIIEWLPSAITWGPKYISLEIDHTKPVSKGGAAAINNLQTLCNRCNMSKGGR